jgi:hypothetical protein
VAEEEEVVLRLDDERVAHEGCGVDNQGHLSSCRGFCEVDIPISSPFPIPNINISINRWRMPSREWENGLCQRKASMVEEGNSESTEETCTHNSGLFCVFITAAIGIPKFDTGPQKSVSRRHRVRVNRPCPLPVARRKVLPANLATPQPSQKPASSRLGGSQRRIPDPGFEDSGAPCSLLGSPVPRAPTLGSSYGFQSTVFERHGVIFDTMTRVGQKLVNIVSSFLKA